MSSSFTHLECTRTGERYDVDGLHNLSAVGAPLFARYDLDHLSASFSRDDLAGRAVNMWRYREVMPLRDGDQEITLEEGFTPLRVVPRLGSWTGFSRLLIKDESVNPTGSFKARGLSAAVTAAATRGVTKLAIPTAGNAGGALAAYAAVADLECHVFMPRDTPVAFQLEVRSCGAHLELVDGLISVCGRIVGERQEAMGWFDMSTLKEPYRVEGKKTMGYEVFEQLGGRLPDGIVYPTGGGTGLIGMWKAFDEMERMGWIGPERPKMFSVQAAGCAPMVRAWESGATEAEPWADAATYAAGLRVPRAVGDFLILRAIRESGGAAVAIPDQDMSDWVQAVGEDTGIFAAPEGGAVAAAVPALIAMGALGPEEEVVLFNTGSGLKYVGMSPVS